jgi:hypothetical protein
VTEADAKGPSPRSGSRRYLLPPGRFARRARGPYIYDQQGDRYLDTWLQDGASFLGHRPQGYARLAKAEIDRGLWGPFPTKWIGRLERAGRTLASIIAASTATAIASLQIINGCLVGGTAAAGRWLPLGGAGERASTATDGWAETDYSRAIDGSYPGVEVYRSTSGVRVPVVVPAPGVSVAGASGVDELSSIVTALLTKGIWSLVNYIQSPDAEERLNRSVDRPVPPGYTRSGVWMIPDEPADEADTEGDEERWNKRLARGWELGVLLPPDPWTPIVVPPNTSTYDETIWQRVCDEWPV